MKDVNKIKNYRTKYKRYYGIEFGSEYVVHHIDLNHSNNDISNLVLLPRSLHGRYHYFVDHIAFLPKFRTEIGGNSFTLSNGYVLDEVEEFYKVLTECNAWYDYKMYLEGDLPNVHHIEL